MSNSTSKPAFFRMMAALKDGRTVFVMNTRSANRAAFAIDGNDLLTASKRHADKIDGAEADRWCSHLNCLLAEGGRKHFAPVAYFFTGRCRPD